MLVGPSASLAAGALWSQQRWGGGAVRMRWASLSANLGNLGSVRLVPRRGLSQHTGWASGGTHRLSSLRGRPEHRLGGTRQARCRPSGVCFRYTDRASRRTHRRTSSRSRPEHRLGGTRQAQWCLLPVHRPGVPKDSTAHRLVVPKDSSAVLLEVPGRNPRGGDIRVVEDASFRERAWS
jgi:hypothetical protein